MKYSEQEFCVWRIRIEVCGFFSFQHSQDSTTQCTGSCEDWVTCFLESLYHLRRYWFPLSFRRVLCFSIRLLFISRTEERPVSLREFLRVCLVLFWIRNTNLVSLLCPIKVFSGSMFRSCKVILDFLNLQWPKSWVSTPVACPPIPSNSL